MLSNPLASSSLPKREVWKSSLHNRLQTCVHTEPRKIFAKFNNFRSVVFLVNSAVPARWRKYCKQKSVKFGGNLAFLCDLAHSFTTNAKQDKIRCLF